MQTKARKKTTPARKAPARKPQTKANDGSIQSSQLMKLFEDELKDIYWAEKALTKAIPKMIKNATSEELIEALQNHLSETEEQVSRVEQVFELLGKKATAKKCEAMAGLIKEAEEIMQDCEEGAMCDAGIISAGQKVEHYEIASYGTLRQFAETLGLTDAVSLLEETLNEEKAADEKLSEVATSAINMQAAGEQENEEEEDEEEEEEEDEDDESSNQDENEE
ncbi:MAG TPA: ferritin-like domain-containing protein [Cytophagaceae bacterium]|nr:ferritin-like domain-containing protein [Cytophagaceae bacterium]